MYPIWNQSVSKMEPLCIQHYKITRQVLMNASDYRAYREEQALKREIERQETPKTPSYTFRFTDNITINHNIRLRQVKITASEPYYQAIRNLITST